MLTLTVGNTLTSEGTVSQPINVQITRGVAPVTVGIIVQNVKPVSIAASQTLNVTASSIVLLDSAMAMHIGSVVTPGQVRLTIGIFGKDKIHRLVWLENLRTLVVR